jgi:hypothetical protein
MIFLAIAQRRDLVLPHAGYRKRWPLKRFLPFLYDRMMAKIGRKIAIMRSHKKTIKTEGSPT